MVWKKTNFKTIAVDHAEEQTNKINKGDGRICGITTTGNPETLMKYCFSTNEQSHMSVAAVEMLGLVHPITNLHHDLSDKKLMLQKKMGMNFKKSGTVSVLSKYKIHKNSGWCI